jgi:2-oxoisovalerate dehydrogenase E2 component (dihydrolipoyl transacylase)
MADRVFVMPDLGEGLLEGEIVAWLVREGQRVELNEPLVEIETAKATVEVPSPFAGVVVRLHAAEGGTIGVGAPLVTFSGDGEGVPEASAASDPAVLPAATPPATPSATREPDEPVLPGRSPAARATPPVRKLAASLGVELSSVIGSGPDGRVLAEDVARAAGAGAGTRDAPTAPRTALARILTTQAAIPSVTTFRTVDCSALEVFRKEVVSSPFPVVVSALARVAAAHPAITASWSADGVRARANIDMGFAVDTTRGLAVPVVRDVGSWNLVELTAELRRLAHAARDGVLQPSDVTGATIAITNMGSYGSEAGTPLLSPGTSVTVGLGAIAPRALVVDGEIQPRPACTLSLTFDHRVLDGAAAGAALTALVALLQSADGLRDLAG